MLQFYPSRFFCLISLMMASIGLSAQVYVKADATGSNNGSSWVNAYTDLQDALANTTSGEIWVAAGTYSPGPNTSDVFLIENDVHLFGGFNGTETTLGDQDPVANPTTLSGDVNGDDVSGDITANRLDNNRHIVSVSTGAISGLEGPLLDGFIIRGGNTDNMDSADPYEMSGGGVYAHSVVTVAQCRFEHNFGRAGGGIYLSDGANGSLITSCNFEDNLSTRRGAGLLLDSADGVSVSDCTFRFNETENGDEDERDTNGAFYAEATDMASVTGCTFEGNVNTVGRGAAFVNYNCLNMDVTDCNFLNNTSEASGGAMYYYGGDLATIDENNFIITDCHFESNQNNGGIGGAIRNRQGPYTIIGSSFLDNTSASSGGHIRNDVNGGDRVVYRDNHFEGGISGGWGGAHTCYGAGVFEIENCTYEANQAARLGGAINCGFEAVVTFDNCLFQENLQTGNGSGGAIALQNDNTAVTVLNTDFISNTTANQGGAIFSGANESSSIVIVDNCLFEANVCVDGFGGAIFINENGPDIATLTVSNSIFNFNQVPVQGGAINISNTNTEITSCVFINNSAADTGTGGAISTNASDSNAVEVLIMNSTFADNLGALSAGIAQWTGDTLAFMDMTMQNSIFSNDGGVNYAIEAGTPTLTSNGGNMSDDDSMEPYLTHAMDLNLESPEFNEPDDFDFSLADGSLGIDAGVADGAPEFDLLGNPRINLPDMGAYENQNVTKVNETLLENDGMLTLSPNPTRGTQTLATLDNEWTGSLELRLTNVQGQTVKVIEVDKNASEEQYIISLEDVRRGVYQVAISNGEQVVVARLIRI